MAETASSRPSYRALLAQLLGFETALLIIAGSFMCAAVTMLGSPDPRMEVASTGSLLRDAWLGLVYTWNNATLRGLAISLSLMNLTGGMVEIVVPVIVLKHLGMGQDVVGYMFGLMGAFGVVSAFLSGRIRTLGRERNWIVASSFGFTAATAMLLLPFGLAAIALSMAFAGLVNGPLDIAMFTLRQRRTDPAWMGRAFTVSMNLNFSGYPIGAAVTGAMLAIWPPEAAIVFGVATNFLGAALAWALLPANEPRAGAPGG